MVDPNFLEEYKQILSITQESITVVQNQNLQHQAELDFNLSNNSWIIFYNINQSEFPFIHELGHIYLAKIKTSYMHFALPPPPNPRLNHAIGNLISNLLDCFVNYSLSTFDEIYPIIQRNDFLYLDNLIDSQNYFERIIDLPTLLGYYSLFYLHFTYILKEEDRNVRNQDIVSFLNMLKNHISNNTTFNPNHIAELTESLNEFNEVKDETDHLRIIHFIYIILRIINLWSEEVLRRQIRLFFPPP